METDHNTVILFLIFQANPAIIIFIIIIIYRRILTVASSTISSLFSSAFSTKSSGISTGFYIRATSVTISGVLTISATPPLTFFPPEHGEAQHQTHMYAWWTVMTGQAGAEVTHFLSHCTTEHLNQRVHFSQPLLDGRELSSEQTSWHRKFYLSKHTQECG